MEERTIRAQFTTNISYLRILRIFQVVQRAVFCLSTKDNTRRNTTKASAQDELLNSNATAMAVLGLGARETPSEQRPLSNTPLPEEVQNQTLPFGQRLKAWCRPSPGLHVELAEGKAPHPQKVHLQVEHEVVKPFFRNAVMEAHCKRGDGTDVNRENLQTLFPPPQEPHARRPSGQPRGALSGRSAACPVLPHPRLCSLGAETHRPQVQRPGHHLRPASQLRRCN